MTAASAARNVLGALALSLATATVAAAETEVFVGVYQNPPKVFLDQSGRASGFFPEILDHIAGREGWTIRYVLCEWSDCLAKTEAGSLDLMLDVAYTRERAERFDFNQQVVLANWSTLYVAKDSGIQSIMDVGGKRIAVLRGGLQLPQFRDWTTSTGVQPRFIVVESNQEVFEAIDDGRVDGGLVNRLYGAQVEDRYDAVRTNVVMAPSQLHFVAARGTNAHLLAAIDRNVERLKDDPDSPYHAAIKRWIVSLEKKPFPAWVKWVFILAAAALGLAFTFAAALRWEVDKKTAALRRSNTMLQSLLTANESLVRAKDEPELLGSICRSAVEDGGFLMAWVGYVTGDGEIELMARHCKSHDLDEEAARGWARVLLDGGVLMRAVKDGRAVVGVRLPWARVPKSKCVVEGSGNNDMILAAFPLIAEGRTIGGFAVLTADPGLFADDVVALLSQMSDDLAFGIQGVRNTRLRIEMERRLLQADKMDALGNLAGGIAHDLKNMLFPIISLTELTLRELPEDSRNRKRLQMVVEAAGRARKLTESIHAFSHKGEVEPEEVAVDDLIESCLGIVRPSLSAAIEIEVEYRFEGPPPKILVDSAQFQTMLLNLASNGAHAIGDAPGRIGLYVSARTLDPLSLMVVPVPKPGLYVEIRFSDSGKGMDKATLDRIFEPYFTTKERGKGAGLGMAMVQKFVVRQGGGIAVGSTPGVGTQFRIYLPVAV